MNTPNDFILNECTFRPLRRFGIDSTDFSVISPSGNPIGVYLPVTNEFLRDGQWSVKWSNELKERVNATMPEGTV